MRCRSACVVLVFAALASAYNAPPLTLARSSRCATPSTPAIASSARTEAPLLKWAGESRAGKLFSADSECTTSLPCISWHALKRTCPVLAPTDIPQGVPPWAFFLGLVVLLVSNLGVAVFVGIERMAPGTMPPINAFTEIANAAMERAVASGEVPKPLATFWAQGLWADLLREYMAAGESPQDFVSQWCESTSERVEWCTAAKEASRAAAAAAARQ